MERHFSLHNRVFVMLSGMLQSGRIPHAILLEGLPGSGTQEAAVHLALSLNCHTNKGTDWACGDCMSCKKIRHGFHPDVHVIFPRTRKTAPGEIQETIEQLSGDPYTPHLIDEGNAIQVGLEDHIVDVVLSQNIPFGHKFSLKDIEQGGVVIKYGETIGLATKKIRQGEHVHVHNVESQKGRGDKR